MNILLFQTQSLASSGLSFPVLLIYRYIQLHHLDNEESLIMMWEIIAWIITISIFPTEQSLIATNLHHCSTQINNVSQLHPNTLVMDSSTSHQCAKFIQTACQTRPLSRHKKHSHSSMCLYLTNPVILVSSRVMSSFGSSFFNYRGIRSLLKNTGVSMGKFQTALYI